MQDYVTRYPRAIHGQWIEGFIRKGENREKAEKAFECFCYQVKKKGSINEAVKIAKHRYPTTSILVEQIPDSPYIKNSRKINRIIIG